MKFRITTQVQENQTNSSGCCFHQVEHGMPRKFLAKLRPSRHMCCCGSILIAEWQKVAICTCTLGCQAPLVRATVSCHRVFLRSGRQPGHGSSFFAEVHWRKQPDSSAGGQYLFLLCCQMCVVFARGRFEAGHRIKCVWPRRKCCRFNLLSGSQTWIMQHATEYMLKRLQPD